MDKTRKINIAIALLPLFLVPLGLLFVSFYRSTLSHYVLPCPILTLFGIYCPGCGGTHCVYAAAEGKLLTALRYNAFFCGLGVLAVLFWAENVVSAFGKRVRLVPRSRLFYVIAGVIAVVYFVLRNIVTGLSPF